MLFSYSRTKSAIAEGENFHILYLRSKYSNIYLYTYILNMFIYYYILYRTI